MRFLPLLLLPSLAFADKKPPPEIVATAAKVDLPAVPRFEVTAPADGLHTVRELMLVAKPIGKEVKVGGYVVAIYRCPLIDTDPTKCERPKIWLGDAKTTPKDRALWIVDVPRPPSKLEKERLPKEDLAKWPAVPKLAVGDHVVISGTFDVKSPHAESNSDGLVIYAGVSSVAAATAGKLVPVPDEPLLQLAPVTVPAAAPVNPQQRDASMVELNTANRFNGQRDFDHAIEAYQRAIALMAENHLAWYGLGGAFAGKNDWTKATDAWEHAVALAPDWPQYQMWVGVGRYERAYQDKSMVFTSAREALLRAVRGEPKLWRANYYLGRIAREAGFFRAAADWFTHAIQANPREESPYIALVELYRRWGFTAQAIQVASQGVANANQTEGRLAFALGVAYEDNKQHDKAIEQLTLAIGAGASQAYFARANAKLAKGDKPGAKHDFEEYVKVGKNPNEVQIAERELLELR